MQLTIRPREERMSRAPLTGEPGPEIFAPLVSARQVLWWVGGRSSNQTTRGDLILSLPPR